MRGTFLAPILLLSAALPPRTAAGTPPAPLRSGSATEERVEFARDVEPLLASRCYRCHGGEKQKGGLRLDLELAAAAGGDSGRPAIVAGDPEASELWRRVTTADEDDRMPAEGEPLEQKELDLLFRWIEGGALRPAPEESHREVDHWSYRAPVRPPLPAVSDEAWCRGAIDRFVLARLEAEGLAPAPEADRATLLRRVSLDLVGLPPTPDELDAFLSDERPDAYERVVDRLLASPHFGERWARHWLDLARYSDSNGYTFDKPREIWPYRDWVIDAYNRDLPFDEFTVEQLAGDLLPSPTRDQLVATGFNRNTMVNEEAGAYEEEFRIEAVKNRVDTTATVWLGSTLACAQCHSHKYDPFTQQDYYRFFAFFDQSPDVGVRRPVPKWVLEPVIELPTPEEEVEDARIDQRVAEIDQLLSEPTDEHEEAFAAWEAGARARAARWSLLTPILADCDGDPVLETQPDGSLLLVAAPPPRTATYTVVARVDLPRVTGVRLEVLPDERFPSSGPGLSDMGNFVLTELEVRASAAPDEGIPEGEPVAFGRPAATFFQSTRKFNHWPIEEAIDHDSTTGWAILPRAGEAHAAVFPFREPVVHEGGTLLTFKIEQAFGLWHVIGRLRLFATDAELGPGPPDVVPPAVVAPLRLSRAERTEAEQREVWRYFTSTSELYAPLRDEQRALEKSRPTPATSLVMGTVEEPRTTHLLLRGNFLTPGPVVEPGVPDFLPPLRPQGDGAPTRLDLARWLVSPDNPLTSRVTVNRLWQRLFGLGIVETENDFGTRGEAPTHPELLDWLAVSFVEDDGWSVKSLLRELVTSATYRQSSLPRRELAVVDPRNRLLARQARLRNDAETIRDSALLVSGLLSPKIGGPPVRPPQPEGVYAFTQAPKDWEESQGPDRYRRTLYTWHLRTSVFPYLTTFDMPEASVPCTRRTRSNTPLQALTLANDPMMVEIARGFAAELLAQQGGDDERLVSGFRRCTAREPEPEERAILRGMLEKEHSSFAADPESARAAAPADLPPGVDAAEGAAWSSIARVLLNLDEFVVRP